MGVRDPLDGVWVMGEQKPWTQPEGGVAQAGGAPGEEEQGGEGLRKQAEGNQVPLPPGSLPCDSRHLRASEALRNSVGGPLARLWGGE